MVKHIVSFKLTGTADERKAVAEKFREALLKLPEQIDVLQSMEVGVNQNPQESWDVVLTAVVPTMEDVATYANHPAHVAAAALLNGHKESRACVDYVC
ncbi:MAG: Dabb family protein [Muribaculaceae bacterium]|nr:Dabb family protein [Muribaculaceae bacterium]